MPDLSSYIDFSVKFDLTTGTPKMILTDTSSYPVGVDEDITGYFSITQPDGGTDSGSWTSPDVTWNGSELTYKEFTLRLNSQGNIQAGNYTITYNIDHPSYVPTVLSRTFNTSYIPASLNLVEDFDVFTPELKYIDQTSYGIPGYSYEILDRLWEASSTPAGFESDSAIFDMNASGQYYDALYSISYYVLVLYQSDTYEYLSILDYNAKSFTADAYTPPPIDELVSDLNSLKDELDSLVNNCSKYEEYKERYEYAASLLFNIKESCNAGILDPLNRYVSEFLLVVNNYVSIPRTHTNDVIPAYDCGCEGGGGSGVNIYNSDGTLTENRTLSGADNTLEFADLSLFKTSIGGNDIGLKLDFADGSYEIGDINAGNRIYYNSNSGDFEVKHGNGCIIAGNVLMGNYQIGNNSLANTAVIDYDNGFKLLQSVYNNNSIGIYLDFDSGGYAFGDYNNVNGDGYLLIDSKETSIISGDGVGGNNCGLYASGNNDTIGALSNMSLQGLKLDFANNNYQFGQLVGGNETYLLIDDNANNLAVINLGAIRGINLDFNNGVYKFGETQVNNYINITIDDATNQLIKTQYENIDTGIKLQFFGGVFQFGKINGGNSKTFTINDSTSFGFQFSGTGITQATTGAASGQYLKVKVGGSDYLIELKNPS